MRKTVILTGYNDKLVPLAAITEPRLEQYADRQGMDFVASRYKEMVNPYWQKIRDVIAAIELYDRALWMDIDQLVTNMDAQLPEYWLGAHFSMDWGVDATGPSDFSACGFIACADSLPLFQWVESVHDQYADGPFPEQTPLRLAYRENRFPGLIYSHPRRLLNAVPIEVHPSAPEPWQPGDFAAHLTMLSVEERVKLARTILARL